MFERLRIGVLLALALVLAAQAVGCKKDEPEADLSLISPHNEHIENEYEKAFVEWHEDKYGSRPTLQWVSVGQGTGGIVNHLLNTYKHAETADIDIVWGGGEYEFSRMAKAGILSPLEMPESYLANVPRMFSGVPMYDAENKLWAGSAVSGFGILYNRELLKTYELPTPSKWGDLADPKFAGLLALADPMKSGSAASTYEMIVQTQPGWPEGWGLLLGILANAKQFYNGASDAADAVKSQVPVATCIDFYGTTRVEEPESRGRLEYVTPRGQSGFGPDPIGILKNPPHSEMAQRFVDFVLSKQGQALWGLKVGAEDGPKRFPLGRQPIRKDVYNDYAKDMLGYIVPIYEGGLAMEVDAEMRAIRFEVLRQLIAAAALDNLALLRKAKARVVASGYAPQMVKQFNELPPDVRTLEQIEQISKQLKDDAQRVRITNAWREFFHDKFKALAG